MNNMEYIKNIAAVICILIGIFLFTVSSDQEFSNVPPIDDAVGALPMKAGVSYAQVFTTNRKTISRLGIYLRPLVKIRDASTSVRILLQHGDTVLGSGSVPAILIENGGPTYIRFTDPIPTFKGEPLSIVLQVPDPLDTAIGLRLREKKGDFAGTDIKLFVDTQEQQNIVAYNAFERVSPPIARQVGGMLIGLGIFLALLQYFKHHQTIGTIATLALISLLAAIPSVDASMSYGIFALFIGVALFTMWLILHLVGRSNLASVFGAALFACSSWLPLRSITQGTGGAMLSMRDALMDPNQIAVSHAAGGYIGIPGALAAIIGLCIWAVFTISSQRKKYSADTIVVVVGIIAFAIAFIPSSLYTRYAIILVVAVCAWFASLSIDALHRLFGKQDRYATMLISILIAVSIMDLMYVGARTLLYGSGI